MDSESRSVIKFLSGIATIHERLQDMQRCIQQRPEVHKATIHLFTPVRMTRFDEHMQESQVIGGDFGVSAEIKDKSVVDWWLEVWWDKESWRIDHKVYRVMAQISLSLFG